MSAKKINVCIQKSKTAGGKRPGAGRKVDIPRRLCELDVAVRYNVGVDHARRMIREGSLRFYLKEERIRDLIEWGSGKDAQLYLTVLEEHYFEMRRRWGFRS
jgi:hypothetical protein